MTILFWVVIGFMAGSIPFSVILSKIFIKKDVRSFGDGNPGGTNAIKAGGVKLGSPVILLDISKAFLPVYLAQNAGLSGMALIPVCLAPMLGHAFSPFLHFKGGKALGTTGGVWVALVGLQAFAYYGALAGPAALIQTEDAWAAVIGMGGLLAYSILSGQAWLIVLCALNTALIVFTHRHDLVRHPHLRAWVIHLFQGRHA